MSTAKPLTASIAERLGLPKPEPERRPAPRTGPPPSAPASKVHQLRPPEGPERSFVEVPEVAAKKKRRARRKFDTAFKANAVKEALEAKAAGGEYKSVATKLDVRDTLLTRWIARAKKEEAKKGSRRWGKASPEVKAEKVKKALDMMAAGKSQMEAAKALDIGGSTLSYWIKAAKGADARAGKADDVVSLSRELAAASERVEAIKKKLRKLLGA